MESVLPKRETLQELGRRKKQYINAKSGFIKYTALTLTLATKLEKKKKKKKIYERDDNLVIYNLASV